MEQFLTSLAPSVEASFLSGTADCGEGEATQRTHLIRLRRESQKSMIKTCFEGLIHFENVLCHGRTFLSLSSVKLKKGSIFAQAASRSYDLK